MPYDLLIVGHFHADDGFSRSVGAKKLGNPKDEPSRLKVYLLALERRPVPRFVVLTAASIRLTQNERLPRHRRKPARGRCAPSSQIKIPN